MRNARSVAVNVLRSIIEDRSYSNIAVDSAIKKAELDRKEASLATTLIYGSLQRKITLERIVEGLSSKKSKLDGFVLSVLLVGLYQILFLDRVPSSAAVNETVNIVKQSKFKFASGFVNAILRKASANRDEILKSIDESRDISYKYSCPVPLLKSLIADYGRDLAEGFLAASLETPKMFARVNTLKTTKDELFKVLESKGIECVESDVENAFYTKNGGSLMSVPEFRDGLFYVQDLASQKAIDALNIASGMRVLDICSAPGGKSFTAAMYLNGDGEIVSCDMYEQRVELIEKGAKRLGINCIKTQVADASKSYDLGSFDRVICDVPCSGFGVIRRKPEIKYKDESFEELQQLQFEILQNAVVYLKENGKLMYSTCTVRCAENEQIIEKFLKANENFCVEEMRTMMPQTDGTDGFFYCILKRK